MASRAFKAVLIFLSLLATNLLHADIVYLKNGKTIECEKAWKEGKEVRYKISSGTVSIPASMVDKIQQSPEVLQPPPQNQNEVNPLTNQRLARFYTDRGIEFLKKKDFAKALQQFEKADGYDSDEITILNLAIAYYYLKDDWNAENHFREVLKRNPDNTDSLNYLAELHWRREELDEASEYWNRSLAVKEDPVVREKLKKLEKERTASVHYDSEQSDHFLIRYDGGNADKAFAAEISTFLEEAYQRLSSQYDFFPSEPIVVILYPGQQYFNVMDVPLWSGGSNDGKIKLPIRGLTALNQELKNMLLHELSHSFVSMKTLKNSPGWLQEGLAKYSEGERTSPQAKIMLQNLMTTRSLPPLRNLEGSFANANTQTASIFYVESLSFVDYLIEHHGIFQMNQFLDRLGKQDSLEDAFEVVYMIPLEEMEQRWRAELISAE